MCSKEEKNQKNQNNENYFRLKSWMISTENESSTFMINYDVPTVYQTKRKNATLHMNVQNRIYNHRQCKQLRRQRKRRKIF